jgi:uncharacterized membrane protein
MIEPTLASCYPGNMNRKSGIRWLFSELPDLVSGGVIDPAGAGRIRSHYGEPEARNAVKTALVIFSILGALLIGGGVILLLAHNWDDLGRGVRAVLSFLPLLAAQSLALWAAWSGRRSAAWREGTGTSLMLAIGSSIALVSQTYHISGEPADFVLTWMLLGLPLVYLLDASAPAAIYWAGITNWAGIQWAGGTQPILYVLLMALAVPHFVLASRENRYAPRPALLGWVLVICLTVGTAFSLTRHTEELWILAYSGVFGVMFLAGSLWFGQGSSAWQSPFRTGGAIGATFLAWLFTFHGVWGHGSYWHTDLTGPNLWDGAYLLVLAAALVWLWAKSLMRKAYGFLLLGAMPALAAICYFVSRNSGYEVISAALFNLYLFGLGLLTVISALRQRKMAQMNLGLLVLSALLLTRFFDSDLSFLFRGVAFIVVGAGFLAANMMMARRVKEGSP